MKQSDRRKVLFESWVRDYGGDIYRCALRLPDHGIWELQQQQHFVSGKLMSWVALERAVRIAKKVDRSEPIACWESAMREIYDDVMMHGWSERQGAFKERYEAESLDASALLIPVMGFLPADHPRVRATIDRIAERLTIDGLVYRFDPADSLGGDLPMGEAEGAFLPCTFWLATAYAKLGRTREAEAIISRVEKIAGPLMLMAEEADPQTNTFLGNTPLLFSQIEYVRAVTELAKARPLSKAMLGVSMAAAHARRTISRWTGR